MRKLNPIPELASLTEAQLETLDGWLSEHSYSKVAQLVAAPAPAGFGLQISRDKLQRHYHRQQAVAQFQDHRDLVGEIEELKLGLQASRTEDLCLELILQKVFALLLEPGHTAKTLNTLFRIATFRQRHELAQHRLRLAEQQVALDPNQPAQPAEEGVDIPVRQPTETASASPSVPEIIPSAAELAPELALHLDSTTPPAFAPLPSAAPSHRQAAEFLALAEAAGLTVRQLTDVVVGLIETDTPTPAKPL